MTRRLGRALLAFGRLAVLTIPLGTATHLFSEAAGLGDASPGVLLSPHHWYLAALAFLALAIIGAVAGYEPDGRRRRERIARVVASLPDRGTGPRFIAASVALQLAFFAATQLAEGAPVAGGNLGLALAGALLASVAGAFAVHLFNARGGRRVDRAAADARPAPGANRRAAGPARATAHPHARHPQPAASGPLRDRPLNNHSPFFAEAFHVARSSGSLGICSSPHRGARRRYRVSQRDRHDERQARR
jgi:hypothetical protein